MLCGANVYLYQISMYSGRDAVSEMEHQPLGTRVIDQMLPVVQAHRYFKT